MQSKTQVHSMKFIIDMIYAILDTGSEYQIYARPDTCNPRHWLQSMKFMLDLIHANLDTGREYDIYTRPDTCNPRHRYRV